MYGFIIRYDRGDSWLVPKLGCHRSHACVLITNWNLSRWCPSSNSLLCVTRDLIRIRNFVTSIPESRGTTNIKSDRLLSRILSVNRRILANARNCDKVSVTLTLHFSSHQRLPLVFERRRSVAVDYRASFWRTVCESCILNGWAQKPLDLKKSPEMEPRSFVTRSRRSLHHARGESLRRAVDSERVRYVRKDTSKFNVTVLAKNHLALKGGGAV